MTAPSSAPGVDVLIVSLATTGGWRTAAASLTAALERSGVTVAVVDAAPAREVRTFMLTDLIQALAARRVAQRGLAEHRPRAVIYCSVTAALLWPRPGAVWLDSPAAENRPGRHGLWQRVVERRRLRQAPVVMTMAAGALDALPPSARPARERVVTVPVPIVASAGEPLRGKGSQRTTKPQDARSTRDIAAVAYAGDPVKKRLNMVLAFWAAARRPGETLVVAGIDALPGGGAVPAGVQLAGRLPAADFRALLRRARIFVAAPAREDFGIVPLEALADGCLLVTTPASGPYPALALARRLDPRLVGEDLSRSIRTALSDPRPDYAQRAAELLVPFSPAAVDQTLAQDVLPELLGCPRP